MSNQHDNFLDLSNIRSPQEQTKLLNSQDFPILQNVSPINLRFLNSASYIMHVSKGVEILHEGDMPDDIYFVCDGKLSVARKIDGKLKVLAYLHSGDVYGEFGALRKKSRYASVFTAEPCRIIRVDLRTTRQVLEVDPDLENKLTQILSYRMLDSFFFTHPVFKNLPDDIRTALARELPSRFIKRGERIFSQGGTPDSVYIILSGKTEIRYRNQAGTEVLLEIRRDADMLGELAQNHGNALAYSAVAASDLDMLKLDTGAMQTIEKFHPDTLKILGAFIDKRAEHTMQRLKENAG